MKFIICSIYYGHYSWSSSRDVTNVTPRSCRTWKLSRYKLSQYPFTWKWAHRHVTAHVTCSSLPWEQRCRSPSPHWGSKGHCVQNAKGTSSVFQCFEDAYALDMKCKWYSTYAFLRFVTYVTFHFIIKERASISKSTENRLADIVFVCVTSIKKTPVSFGGSLTIYEILYCTAILYCIIAVIECSRMPYVCSRISSCVYNCT